MAARVSNPFSLIMSRLWSRPFRPPPAAMQTLTSAATSSRDSRGEVSSHLVPSGSCARSWYYFGFVRALVWVVFWFSVLIKGRYHHALSSNLGQMSGVNWSIGLVGVIRVITLLRVMRVVRVIRDYKGLIYVLVIEIGADEVC